MAGGLPLYNIYLEWLGDLGPTKARYKICNKYYK